MGQMFRLAKWQNGKMGKLFQTRKHGASIKLKEMLNYLEGGPEENTKLQSEM